MFLEWLLLIEKWILLYENDKHFPEQLSTEPFSHNLLCHYWQE